MKDELAAYIGTEAGDVNGNGVGKGAKKTPWKGLIQGAVSSFVAGALGAGRLDHLLIRAIGAPVSFPNPVRIMSAEVTSTSPSAILSSR